MGREDVMEDDSRSSFMCGKIAEEGGLERVCHFMNTSTKPFDAMP